jgi:hypothetical protein
MTERAMVRFNDTHVSVLCHMGHLITARQLDKTWGGSYFEAEVAAWTHGLPNSFDRQSELCQGAGHDPEA